MWTTSTWPRRPPPPAAATSLPTRARRQPLSETRPPTPLTSRTDRGDRGPAPAQGTSLSLWSSNGADLSADANLPVTNDIDLGARVRPDIGADEIAATALYRSVGITATALASGAGNALTISGSTATFASGASQQHRRGRRDPVRLGRQRQHRRAGLHPRPHQLPDLHGQEQERRTRPRRWPATTTGPSTGPTRRSPTGNRRPRTPASTARRATSTRRTNLVTANTIMIRRVLRGRGRHDSGHHQRLDHRCRQLHRHLHSRPALPGRDQPAAQRGVGHDEVPTRVASAAIDSGRLWIQRDYVRVDWAADREHADERAPTTRPASSEPGVGSASDVRLSHNILRATGAGVRTTWTGRRSSQSIRPHGSRR